MLESFWQYLLPQHLISTIAGKVTNSENPALKNWLITQFIKTYHVNMQEAAESNPAHYVSFNQFFTRPLRSGVRSFVNGEKQIACPVDGAVSQVGQIENGRIFQAKNHSFTTQELLAEKELANLFTEGEFATLYLAPKDYHRIHMPVAGKLRQMVYIPGRLFSVNTATTNQVPQLFARNERVVAIFDTAFGPMALVLVGAMLVASISTVWHGIVTPPRHKDIKLWDYADSGPGAIQLERGTEMGHFELGSTVILLFPKNTMRWANTIIPSTTVRLGQLLGDFQ